MADRHVNDERNYQYPQGDADRPLAKIQATLAGWHGEPVREGRAEWPGDDIGEPESDNFAQAEKPVSDGRNGEHDREQNPGSKETEMERYGRQGSGRCPP